MTTRKGIILAGGTGSRLFPVTLAVSKQLLPVYDKPMICYPLSTLMQAGIRDILVITAPGERSRFERLLGEGSDWGIRLTYATQARPNGIAEALLIAEEFLAGAPCALILGDNIFHGAGLPAMLSEAASRDAGATVFACRVRDPQRYGILAFGQDGKLQAIVEKPSVPPSDFAVTGLYCYDGRAPALAATLRPSARGELEITDLNNLYLREGSLEARLLPEGFAWLDAGTHDSLLEAGQYISTIENRQGLLVGSPEETAFRNGWIDAHALRALAARFPHTAYGRMLAQVADLAPHYNPLISGHERKRPAS